MRTLIAFIATLAAASISLSQVAGWRIGDPIVSYWCGPAMSDSVAKQMKEGGWNLVWCSEKELDIVRSHGLRGQLMDPLISPATLDNPEQRARLDALIARVKNHPALYSYYIVDEPNASQFAALSKLVAYLRERDPGRLAYINLFPTYATNEQLGNKGDATTAYTTHLKQYVETVKPALISYDHYQFSVKGDESQYFLNLALIRRSASEARLPFLNIVQACTWAPHMRVPTSDEMRYLLYTTLAYGGQGVSYYIYTCAGHTGGIADKNGNPTPLYHALKTLNPEFVAIARELQELRSLGAFHAGMLPPGAAALPVGSKFAFDPPFSAATYRSNERVTGALIGEFGADSTTTHAVVVNLDYKTNANFAVVGPANLEVFDAAKAQWMPANSKRVPLELPGGGGKLLRVRP